MRLPRQLLSLTLLWLAMAAPAHAITTVTVLADSSMNIAVTELARDYARRAGAVVNAAFTSRDKQETTIDEGSAADVLITPSVAWIEELKTRGLLDIYSQTDIARNRLALVAPSKSTLRVRLQEGFPTAALIREFGWQPSFVIGNPEALMEGVYGKEALRAMNAAADMEEYTLYVKRLDQIQTMIANYDMYGVLFYSSTIGKPGLRVLDLFPEETHEPITYYGMAIAGDNMEAAREFLAYLKTDPAKIILRNNGFSVN